VCLVTSFSELKLIASDRDEYDEFGFSVSLSPDGNKALVGAYGSGGSYAGEAYIYEKDEVSCSWNEVAKLTASDGADENYFGWSVAFGVNIALVGAEGATPNGAVYVFEREESSGNWVQKHKLTGSSATWFGSSIAVSGNLAIIGDQGNGGTTGAGEQEIDLFSEYWSIHCLDLQSFVMYIAHSSLYF
jgi:hypothetical protein